ncbi:MAG: TatD family hydrolase [Dehalococcoidia bacterium]
MSAELFDTHTHVQLSQFDADRDAVLSRAREAGLVGMLVLGTDVATSEAALALAKADPGIFAAAGCHPHDAKDMDDAAWQRLAALARDPQIAVVGEIGLDFYRNFSPQDTQIDALRRQLDIASEVSKPIALHCRDANDALFPLIETWSKHMGGALPDGRPLGVMHYFSGDVELAHRYVGLGFMISIHCSVTYPKAQQLQNVARSLALDTLVLETDSPFGPPQSQRGQRNEPAYVSEAVAKIAELRSETIDSVAEATTENAVRLFAAARTPAAAATTGDHGAYERAAPCA